VTKGFLSPEMRILSRQGKNCRIWKTKDIAGKNESILRFFEAFKYNLDRRRAT
jgi:hypothetical protein